MLWDLLLVEKIKNFMAINNLQEIKERVFSSGQIKSNDLEELLKYRQEDKIDFKLIDIREIYEYSDESIDGTDLLYPTTIFHKYIDDLNAMKNENIILYCRTGNRTGQVLGILKTMDFKNIAHLTLGIVSYSGKTSKNAKLPQKKENIWKFY